MCKKCNNEEGIMKPDITFFGESLSEHFAKSVAIDLEKIDLLIVIGSSLKVQPVSSLTSFFKNDFRTYISQCSSNFD